GPRAGVTTDMLARLKPAFTRDGTVTAGNASSINDGAADVVVTTPAKAQELGLAPMVKIAAYGNAAVDPAIMGIGPVPATKRCLQRADWTVDGLDLVEANEACAAQSTAVTRELGWS